MVSALGGPADLVESPSATSPAALVIRPVPALDAGFVRRIATRDVGVAVVALGGGRTRPQDPVDHAVGFTDLAGLNEVDRRATARHRPRPHRGRRGGCRSSPAKRLRDRTGGPFGRPSGSRSDRTATYTCEPAYLSPRSGRRFIETIGP